MLAPSCTRTCYHLVAAVTFDGEPIWQQEKLFQVEWLCFFFFWFVFLESERCMVCHRNWLILWNINIILSSYIDWCMLHVPMDFPLKLLFLWEIGSYKLILNIHVRRICTILGFIFYHCPFPQRNSNQDDYLLWGQVQASHYWIGQKAKAYRNYLWSETKIDRI